MARNEELIRKIIDDIEAGLIDDPIEDYKYLSEEAQKYKDHEFAEDIMTAVGKMLYEDIPTMARKALKKNLSGDVASYNTLIDEAHQLMLHGQWGAAATILNNLIGDGINVDDTDEVEFRTIDEEIQQILYKRYFKPENKEIIMLPINLGKLYGLYGCALIEFKHIEEARTVLSIALHYNPLNFSFFFEYSETYKIQGDLETYEQLNRKYLEYAYKAVDIARLYRNIGYAYIEKKDYETAVTLYCYSQAYDPDDKMAGNELEYIAHLTGHPVSSPTQEAADNVMNRESLQIGVSKGVLDRVIRYAYIESHLNHDVEKTEYFCKMIFDLTRNEKLCNEYMSAAKDASSSFGGILGGSQTSSSSDYVSPYDIAREKSLREVFPDYPEIKDCKLRITFTLGSVKYEDTIHQILAHIDELSKLVDKKDITVFFADLKSVAENIKYVNDLIAVGGGWKSFKLTLNSIPRDKYEFRYFIEYLNDKYGVHSVWNRTAEEIRKEYNKEAAPKRAKKAKVEDSYKVDLEGCTPQDIVTGLANTYASVYLSEYNVNAIRVSEDEIILSANDDFVVDIWVSPFGYAHTMFGEPDDSKPYEWCTYIIQELTQNNLFKFNEAGFKRIFIGADLPLHTLRFNGPDYYRPEVNHFHKIDKAYPELRLQEKYDERQGEPYTFIIFEMENADGSIGKAIGVTDKKPRTLLVKICKELETRTPFYLEGNGAPGLSFPLSKTFIKAFLSWKGEKKTKRLENHLRYYSFEKILKDKTETYRICEALMNEALAGQHDTIERKTYADIGRR